MTEVEGFFSFAVLRVAGNCSMPLLFWAKEQAKSIVCGCLSVIGSIATGERTIGRFFWRDFLKNLNLLNLEESIGNISLATGTFVMMQLTGADQQCASWVLSLALFHLLLLLSVSVCLSCVLFERWHLWLCDSKTVGAF